MDKLTEIHCQKETELKAYRKLFEETLQTENPILQIALSHLLKEQGKMMRPKLVLLAARMAGRVGESVLHAAVALELLHTASLVHDDVIDESDRRRGQKSLNALLGNKAAVLVGDFLLSKALYHSAQTGSQQVVTWVSELGQNLSDGELLQLVNLDKTDITEEDYFEVIRKKTASLFETCARTGCLLAGGEEELVERMAQFGRSVGMSFQMRDDLLDYDTQHDTGKPSGNDMKEGKLTLPVIHALLTTGDEEMRKVALKVRKGEATNEEIANLVQFTHQHGGIEYTKQKMEEKVNASIRLFENQGGAETSILEDLKHYAYFVADRKL